VSCCVALDYYISLSAVLWTICGCFGIVYMSCDLKFAKCLVIEMESKRFLGKLVYLRFSKVDAFFSKDKFYGKCFLTFLCPGGL